MALVATILRLFNLGVKRIPNIWILDEAGAGTSRMHRATTGYE